MAAVFEPFFLLPAMVFTVNPLHVNDGTVNNTELLADLQTVMRYPGEISVFMFLTNGSSSLMPPTGRTDASYG